MPLVRGGHHPSLNSGNRFHDDGPPLIGLAELDVSGSFISSIHSNAATSFYHRSPTDGSLLYRTSAAQNAPRFGVHGSAQRRQGEKPVDAAPTLSGRALVLEAIGNMFDKDLLTVDETSNAIDLAMRKDDTHELVAVLLSSRRSAGLAAQADFLRLWLQGRTGSSAPQNSHVPQNFQAPQNFQFAGSIPTTPMMHPLMSRPPSNFPPTTAASVALESHMLNATTQQQRIPSVSLRVPSVSLHHQHTGQPRSACGPWTNCQSGNDPWLKHLLCSGMTPAVSPAPPLFNNGQRNSYLGAPGTCAASSISGLTVSGNGTTFPGNGIGQGVCMTGPSNCMSLGSAIFDSAAQQAHGFGPQPADLYAHQGNIGMSQHMNVHQNAGIGMCQSGGCVHHSVQGLSYAHMNNTVSHDGAAGILPEGQIDSGNGEIVGLGQLGGYDQISGHGQTGGNGNQLCHSMQFMRMGSGDLGSVWNSTDMTGVVPLKSNMSGSTAPCSTRCSSHGTLEKDTADKSGE